MKTYYRIDTAHNGYILTAYKSKDTVNTEDYYESSMRQETYVFGRWDEVIKWLENNRFVEENAEATKSV